MIVEIKKELCAGTFGIITLINATLNCQKEESYYKNSNWRGLLQKEGGSTLINQAIHTLDLVIWIKGMPVDVKSYSATLKFKDIIETEDTFASIMKFKDRSLALLSSTNTSIDQWDSKIEVIGTKGSITFSTGFPVKILNLIHEDFDKTKSLKTLIESYSENREISPSMNYYGTTHREQMADFFNVVSGKSNQLQMSPKEALKTLMVVQQLYQYD